MRKAKNTSKEIVSVWPFVDSHAIERQESRGQQEIVGSDQLPRKCNSPRNTNAAEQYHKMGIRVFTTSKGDDLFLGVNLPTGWKKEATDHSMWNNLVDDNGRVRAMFFYKAAFYDRDAFINFETRYDARFKVEGENCWYEVTDNGENAKILFSTSPTGGRNYARIDILQKEATDWLNANFPLWEDINAYW